MALTLPFTKASLETLTLKRYLHDNTIIILPKGIAHTHKDSIEEPTAEHVPKTNVFSVYTS